MTYGFLVKGEKVCKSRNEEILRPQAQSSEGKWITSWVICGEAVSLELRHFYRPRGELNVRGVVEGFANDALWMTEGKGEGCQDLGRDERQGKNM